MMGLLPRSLVDMTEYVCNPPSNGVKTLVLRRGYIRLIGIVMVIGQLANCRQIGIDTVD